MIKNVHVQIQRYESNLSEYQATQEARRMLAFSTPSFNFLEISLKTYSWKFIKRFLFDPEELLIRVMLQLHKKGVAVDVIRIPVEVVGGVGVEAEKSEREASLLLSKLAQKWLTDQATGARAFSSLIGRDQVTCCPPIGRAQVLAVLAPRPHLRAEGGDGRQWRDDDGAGDAEGGEGWRADHRVRTEGRELVLVTGSFRDGNFWTKTVSSFFSSCTPSSSSSLPDQRPCCSGDIAAPTLNLVWRLGCDGQQADDYDGRRMAAPQKALTMIGC